MKRVITIIFLAIAFSSIATAQNECKVPISIQMVDATDGKVKNIYDNNWVQLVRYFERHGFTAEVYSTRIGISLVTTLENEKCDMSNPKMNVELRFIDSYTDSIYYSAKLDKYYSGIDSYDRQKQLVDDLAGPFPQLDSLADTIRTCVINAFEQNTRHIAELAHEYATKGDQDIALFTLVQYPSCCPSYPKINNLMVAIFREYMSKNHSALIDISNSILSHKNAPEIDARFVVSLLNSVQFTEKEQRKADRLFKKIAREYPSLDLMANKDYIFDPELKQIAIREARNIGMVFGKKEAASRYDGASYLRSQSYISDFDKNHNNNDDGDWYPAMMKSHGYNVECQQFKGANESWWK